MPGELFVLSEKTKLAYVFRIPGSFDTVRGPRLTDMQLVVDFNKSVRILLSAIDTFSKKPNVVLEMRNPS